MHICTVGQTQWVLWQLVICNAIGSLNDHARTEESGAYKILQAISHNLILVSAGFDKFTCEIGRYTRCFRKH